MPSEDDQKTNNNSFANLGHDLKEMFEKVGSKLKENFEWLGSHLKSGINSILGDLESVLDGTDDNNFQCNCLVPDNISDHETNVQHEFDCHCHYML